MAELLASPFPAAVVSIDVENLREQAFVQAAVRLLGERSQYYQPHILRVR